MSGAFEAHGLSALDTLAPETKFECGVCWRVYDPAEGDDYWQIPAGTSFADLPEHWTCPNCDTPREKFIALHDDAPEMEARIKRLSEAYQALADGDMKNLPISNPRLNVECVAFRPFGEDWIGMVIAPWFMNATILPGDASEYANAKTGEKVTRSLPAGEFEFVVGHIDGVGPVLTCSLFSPMDDFATHDAAQETALAAMAALFNKNIDHLDAEPPRDAPEPAPDRRALIFGRKRATPEAE